LSRYNPSTTCASCAQRHVPPLLSPAWLWDSEELRRALADVDLGAALSVIRAAVGLSQLEFATLLGWSQSGVARAESGQRDTLYDIRRLLEVADALDMPRAALVPVLVGLGSVADEGPQWEVTDDVILSRRQLGGVMVGLSASTGSRRMRIPATVDAAHVRHLNSYGDPAAAVALHRNSLDGQLMSRNSANYRAQLAAALTANGDVAAALVEGAAVLPMLDDGHITSSRTLEMLREVRDAAAQHHRGHDFCARFDQAIGASA